MSKLIHTVLGSRAGYGLTILRIFVGIIFAAHGSQKLFGWFGGYGIAGTGGWLESIGFKPGKAMAIVTGLAELLGGLALALGLLTPLAAAVVIASLKIRSHWLKTRLDVMITVFRS